MTPTRPRWCCWAETNKQKTVPQVRRSLPRAGVNPVKEIFFFPSPLQSAGRENKSHLASSQQHALPLSLQLAHCKPCRRGVPNKQVTRVNITRCTLFSLESLFYSVITEAPPLGGEKKKTYGVNKEFLSLQPPSETLIGTSVANNFNISHLKAKSRFQVQWDHKRRDRTRQVFFFFPLQDQRDCSRVSNWQWCDLIKSVFEEPRHKHKPVNPYGSPVGA